MDEFEDPYISALFAGTPTPRRQVTANLLRRPPATPKPLSSSVSTSTMETVPPQQQYGAPEGVSALRGSQVSGAQQALERDRAELERLQQPPDYSGMQQYARERSEGGGRALMLALAAQEAGKEFAPVQGMLLKRAMEAREPIKTATGLITETGEHVEDPMAKMEQKMRVVQARIAQNNQILQSAATAEEQAAARAENAQLARERMEMMMSMKQMGLAVAQSAQASVQAARTGADRDRIYRGEDRMKNDYEQVTKAPREGLQASRSAQVVLTGAAGRKLSNVEQQALITLFNKFLDPGSVVREGEFNRMAQGMGLGQRIQNWQDKIISGSIITPQMAAEIGRVAALYEKDALGLLQQQAAQYQTIAQQRGFDPSAVITDPRFRPAQEQGPPEGAVRVRGAPAPAAAAPTAEGPPPGAVRVKGAR